MIGAATIGALAIAFLASVLLCRLGGVLVGRLGGVDQPGARRSHTSPTPRGGGIGIALVASAWFAWQGVDAGDARWILLALACVALGVVGLLDDLRDLPALTRLLAQLLVVGSFVALVAPAVLDLGAWRPAAGALTVPVLVLATLVAVNFFNFMDGIDGMAGTEAVFAAVTLAALAADAGDRTLAVCCLGLAAAAAGFLPWNLVRARLFMGDVGSTVLGLALAGLGILGAARGTWTLLLPALVSSVFLVDASATLLARMRAGERWYTAHRDHAYQRLVDRGWSHQRVTACYLGLNLLLVLPAAWLSRDSDQVHPLVCITVWTTLTILWGLARRR